MVCQSLSLEYEHGISVSLGIVMGKEKEDEFFSMHLMNEYVDALLGVPGVLLRVTAVE